MFTSPLSAYFISGDTSPPQVEISIRYLLSASSLFGVESCHLTACVDPLVGGTRQRHVQNRPRASIHAPHRTSPRSLDRQVPPHAVVRSEPHLTALTRSSLPTASGKQSLGI